MSNQLLLAQAEGNLLKETFSASLWQSITHRSVARHSVDSTDMETVQRQDEWQTAGVILTAADRTWNQLALTFYTNIMYKVASELAICIPLLHMTEAEGTQIFVPKDAQQTGDSVIFNEFFCGEINPDPKSRT